MGKVRETDVRHRSSQVRGKGKNRRPATSRGYTTADIDVGADTKKVETFIHKGGSFRRRREDKQD